jgi:hypothetical protein
MRRSRQDAIRVAMAYPMSDILTRYRKDTGVSARVAREHERELKRYLALCATRPRGAPGYPMAGPVDALWHTFLLFTREYADFCEKVAGHFLHHVPAREGGPAVPATTLLEFLRDYERAYGEPAPNHIWPRPTPGFRVLGSG